MNKISIDGFLREYGVSAKQSGSAMESFIKKHVVNNYVNYLEKCVWCDNIIKMSCHEFELDKEGNIVNEYVKINSATRYVAFIMRLIDLYTDIEINFENAEFVNQYDKLNKVGAIGHLMSGIPQNESDEFSTLLAMKLDDFRDNEYSITAFLYNFKKSIALTNDVINKALESEEFKTIVEEFKAITEDENK